MDKLTEKEILEQLKENAEKELMEVKDLKTMRNSFCLKGLYATAWQMLPEKIQETLQLVKKFRGDKEKADLAKRSLLVYLKDFASVVEADIEE